ncbi:hypothetical protein THRCLA_04799 [Thraustotheca clavata]|uniref:Cytochrome P450 n=1 Tax=Thraustotheca clavata TaxID=74557 RepID=A0A1V9ZY26_9STRA|nr:hypothetical protein THRCLA_04799 [Thraustotheca clavata]
MSQQEEKSGLGLGTAFLVVVPIVGVVVYRFAKHPLKSLPGPVSKSAFYGNAREFGSTSWSETNRFPEPFTTWTKKYGGAFYYRVFFYHRVNLSDPQALKHVLVTNSTNYPRSDVSRAIFQNMTDGQGLLNSEDPLHAAQRKTFQPQFTHNEIKSYISIFDKETQTLEKYLDENEGSVLDIPDTITRLTLNIIGKAAFSYDFKTFDKNNEQAKVVLDSFELLNAPPKFLYTMGLIYIPGFKHWPLQLLKQINKAKKALYEIIENVIEHKSALQSINNQRDLLDMMLASNEMTPKEARVHVMTFMFAGHETTSNTLCWILAMLSQHPEVEVKVAEECFQAIKTYGATWDIVDKLPFLTATIKETMRMYPTAPFIASRVCLQDDNIPLSDGTSFYIPKGSHVSFSTGAINRNPLYWSQPDMFLPERFIESSSIYEEDRNLRNGRGNTFMYMPFSAGSKNCIGKRFALVEMQLVLAKLLSKYKFSCTSDAVLFPKMTGVTIKPKNLKMTVHRRTSAL